MIIKPYSCYNEQEILDLYRSVGWSNYYEHPQMLRGAYAASLCTLGAYEEGRLVGIIRCVGDGCSILFIQDLLVRPEFQRRGIGSALIKAVLARYPRVYQIQLATDSTDKTTAFYRSLGFQSLEELGCCGMMRTST